MFGDYSFVFVTFVDFAFSLIWSLVFPGVLLFVVMVG